MQLLLTNLAKSCALVEHTHAEVAVYGVLGGRAASGRVAAPPPAAGASPAAAAGRCCARREDAQRGLGSRRGQPVGNQVPIFVRTCPLGAVGNRPWSIDLAFFLLFGRCVCFFAALID